MDFVFADDSRQKTPSRDGMGALVAIGGVYVPGNVVGKIEKAIDELCSHVGFPDDQQFKWSPGKKESYMKDVLTDEKRLDFYRQLCELGTQNNVSAFVTIADTSKNFAISDSRTHEMDITALFLERANWVFSTNRNDGVVVVATPSGGATDHEKFILGCIDLLQTGTRFSSLNRIPLPVLISKARHIRLLQFADIVTSCTTARFAGERYYSPEVFQLIKPLFRKDLGRIGGVGVKVHPDYTYANLYHWVLGDTFWKKSTTGIPLPNEGYKYYTKPNEDSGTTS